MNKIFAIASTAVLAFAGLASAVDNKTIVQEINVNVAKNVSIWNPNPAGTINLTMDGQDANNMAYASSSLNYVNNTPATISVKVDGALPDYVQFYINTNPNPANVAYDPFGSWTFAATTLRWGPATGGGGNALPGTTQVAYANIPAGDYHLAPGVKNFDYMALSPLGLPAPTTTAIQLTVTWTIAPNS